MKRHALRRLRAAALAAIAEQPIWQIYEPAMQAMLAGRRSAVVDLLPDSALMIMSRMAGAQTPNSSALTSTDRDPPTTRMIGSVAVLPIAGVMQPKPNYVTRYYGGTSTEIIERDFRAALGSDQVRAIVLYCDSPGGSALGNEELARAIHAARGTKPIVAFVRGLCASAAYYVASAADRIVASPSSLIGSVGTIMVHAEASRYLEEIGFGVTVLTFGDKKGHGNQYEKLKPEARVTLQKLVDDCGTQFVTAVARNRGASVANVRERFGGGQVFLADEARTRGLVDAVGEWEPLLAELSGSVSTQLPARNQAANQANHQPVIQPASVTASKSSDRNQENAVVNKIKAWLFAHGLIASLEASDEVALAAASAYLAGRGQAVPEGEEKLLAALKGMPTASGAAATSPAPSPSPQPAAGAPANNVQAAHDREVAEARAASRVEERERVRKIRSRGRVLGISEERIEEACNSDQTDAQILAAWTDQLAAENAPVTAPASGTGVQGGAGGAGGGVIRVAADGHERYMADATLAALLHLGQGDAIPEAQVTPQIRQLANAPLIVHAEQCLRAAGVRYDPYDREATAQQALAMGGYERLTIRADGGIAYNRPGAFPDLLSALATKILDAGVEAADTSYQDYTGLWPGDLPDFKPAPVVAKGQVGELDEVLDAEAFKEAKLDQECLSYMQLARFGNQVALTPYLLANDDLSAFMEDLLGLSEGWELTVNRGCLRLVAGNVTLLDNLALYHSTHANLITTPGNEGPSTTSWNEMQKLMAAQQTIGNKARTRARLSVALVTPKHEVAAVQTFAPMRDLAEMKVPVVDSNLNVFRGRVKVVVEPDLQDYSNDVWYGFSDPRRFRDATIVRAYFRGWGRRGKRERWYDPKTKCWHVSLEGRAGFAAKQYRTTVRNPGA